MKLKTFFHDLFKNATKVKRLRSKIIVVRINAKNMFLCWFDRNRKLKIVVTDILLWWDDLWLVNLYRHVRAFLINIKRFIELYDAGFRIGCFTDPDLAGRYREYRFFWKKTMLKDMGDIGRFDDHWTSIFEGRVEHLDQNDLKKFPG